MSEFKEVWYVWDGVHNQPLNKIVDAVIGIDNRVNRVCRRDDDEKFKNEFLWIDWPIIKMYTLGEKRRRCVGCGGAGSVELTIKRLEGSVFYLCDTCGGAGWEYEK